MNEKKVIPVGVTGMIGGLACRSTPSTVCPSYIICLGSQKRDEAKIGMYPVI